MTIQATIVPDQTLAELPSIQIDPIRASVSLDDRLDADSAFRQPFVAALHEGMNWYLQQRGLRVLESGAELRLGLDIISYAGDKGWGEWGVEIHLEVYGFRGPDPLLRTILETSLIYASPREVVRQEIEKYRPTGATVNFSEVLYTRVGIDICEKLIAFLKEKVWVAAPDQATTPPAAVPDPHGVVAVDASVPYAEVLLDEGLIGTTPVDALVLPAGTHRLEVRHPGFLVWARDIVVLAGSSSRFHAVLVPDPGNQP